MRKSVKDKVKGAAVFFVGNSELDTEKDNAQDNEQVNTQGSEEHTDKDSKQDNEQSNTQHTTQCTTKYTVGKPVKSELVCERLVANVTKSQKKYVKDMAKYFENESDFVRFMIDYFIQNIEIK